MKFSNLRLLSFGCLSLLSFSTLIGQDAVPTNPDLFRILYENERVRVLDQRLEPGRSERIHSHPPYVKYVLTSYRGTVTYSNGNTSAVRRIEPGRVMWFDKEIHAQKNSGKTVMHAIMFELKGAHVVQPTPETPDDPLKVAGKTHKLLFENEWVRVLEFRLQPKESTPSHHHRDGVFYVLSGGNITETLSDGKTNEVTLSDADVKWTDARSHKVKNSGTTEVKMVMVELKD
jgi:quercetin dioxygenase-like cupin family protein